MCGITGSLNVGSTGYSVDSAKIQFAMMLASTLRGVDGTGYIRGPLDMSKGVTYSKSAVAATEFMDRTKMIEIVSDARFFVGHTRASTIGGNVDEACHPFSNGPVCGVHNGTVHDTKFIFPEIEGINDSEVIYKALAEAEPDKATEILAEIETGAYALVWYDSRLNALRFARNGDRPLWFYRGDNIWWWASEPGTIASCIASVKRDPLSYQSIRPWQLDKHVLMTLPIDGGEATAEPYTAVYTTYGRGYTYPSRQSGAQYDVLEQGEFWSKYYDAHGYDPRPNDTKIRAGWVSLFSGDSLYQQPEWFTIYRNNVRRALCTLFKGGMGRSIVEFGERLLDLAAKTGTCNSNPATPTILFAGQAVNDISGMVYGAIDVKDFGPMPIVGKLSDNQLRIYASHPATGDAKVAKFTARIDSIKAYCTGDLGMGVTDLVFMGWEDEAEAITLTEDAVGSVATHPHLLPDVWDEAVDWSIWLAN